MAPKVASSRSLSEPASEVEQKVAELRKHVEENATYVGGSFAKEAREMHERGETEKSIWGEARPDEAKALIEDGIKVAPLPFAPRAKAN